jgi:hypothetical protein
MKKLSIDADITELTISLTVSAARLAISLLLRLQHFGRFSE